MVYVLDVLDRVTAGTCRRLMLFLPPRHGKSELVTVRYPVWRLERDPTTRVVLAAYSQVLADTFSRKARRIAEHCLQLADDRTAVEQWETAAGGGLRAVGVGGGITGQGADLVIVDDPVKSREEAESQAYRERVWRWYTDDLYTRLEPGGQIILVMTRWHTDDLAGRILESEGADEWTVVTLPAEAEDDDPLGRAPGDPLCPERFDLPALAEIRRTLGTRSYTSLYQQRPTPPAGEMIRRDWFAIVGAPPSATTARVRYWDLAATEGGGDYTAGVLMARTSDGLWWIEDVMRGQWSSGQRDAIMRQTCERDGANTYVRWEEQPGSAGRDLSAALTKHLAGWPILPPERTTGSKVVRAQPLIAQSEAQNVRLVRGDWVPAFLDEAAAFPAGAHDDQIDAAAGALNTLAGQVRRPLAPVRLTIRGT